VLGAIARWSVVPIVFAVLAAGVVRYSMGKEARSSIRWKSANDFMSSDGPFRESGFTVDCDFGGTDPKCAVNWTRPNDPTARELQVYECDVESNVSRDAVLTRFAKAARPLVSQAPLDHSLAVLNAFFQSGLRREIDRAVGRARSHRQFANRMPPFKLTAEGGAHRLRVDGIDEVQQAIPTGLPRRPAYGAPVFARWENTRSNFIEVTVRAAGRETSVWLNPASPVPCAPIRPGDPSLGGCASVAILACRRAAGCDEPVMNVRAVSTTSAIVTRASATAGALLTRALASMNTDDIVVSDAANGPTTLYVRGTRTNPEMVVEITHDTRPSLSRLQMVNGRWTRWYDPAVERWLAPVVVRMDQFTSENRIPNPNAPMQLSLDLGLQRDLDRQLETWMRVNAEPNVAADMKTHETRLPASRPFRRETGHHRPAPAAGVTVLDAQTGEILAVASYPPATALRYDEGLPTFARGWKQRLAGTSKRAPLIREIVSELAQRIEDDVNSNFVRHPIGSTIKPVLVSLVMDRDTGLAQPDGLDRFFDLSVAGHLAYGGEGKAPTCGTCTLPQAEAIAGLPLGPWGDEEAGWRHRPDPWIDRRDFILASCNKYAVTFGVLSLLDWSGTASGNAAACCWLGPRDQFRFDGARPGLYDSPAALPPVGRWLDSSTLATIPETATAPIFQRLMHYYGVQAISNQQVYDSSPWLDCVNVPGLAQSADPDAFVGRVETTQLSLTSNRISTAFTNIFTGAGRNWWTNVKLAEAYARIATNRPVRASFCGGTALATQLFRDTARWQDLTGIMSHQRAEAFWVASTSKANLDAWVAADASRMTASKTGTSLRDTNHASTGIFAVYIGGASSTLANGDRIPNGRGLVVVAHIDDIGGSDKAVALVNSLMPWIGTRIR
jgi:hypothetical protein